MENLEGVVRLPPDACFRSAMQNCRLPVHAVLLLVQGGSVDDARERVVSQFELCHLAPPR
jgi:hypothetical protein